MRIVRGLGREQVASDLARLHRHWLLTIVVLVCTLLLPDTISGPLFILYGGISAVVAWRISNDRTGDIRRLGRAVILTGVVFLVGGVVRVVEATIRKVEYPFPAIADLFSLGAFGLFLYSISFVIRKRNPHLSLDPILDALVGVVAVGIIQWTVILLPYIRDPTHSSAETIVTVGFGFVSLTTIGMAVLALVAGSVPSASNRLLAGGLVMAFASDVLAVKVTGGGGSDVLLSLVNTGVVALGAAGLLHPSIERLFERPNDDLMDRRLSRRRVLVLSFALVTPPVVLTYEVLSGSRGVELLLPAVGAIVLAPMVLLRLGRLVRDNERLASQERALRQVGEQLVESSSDQDVAMVLDSGLQRLAGELLIDGGLVVAPFDSDSVGWTTDISPALRAAIAEVKRIDQPRNGEILELASVGLSGHWHAGLLVLQQKLRAVLVMGIKGSLTDVQRNAMTALCRQGAIAMRAVERTEEQVRERAERRFATLIENSSDIVTILDEDDVLIYTSPVSKRLLGLEPLPGFEFRIDQLVHRDDQEKACAMLEAVHDSGYATEELRLQHLNGTYLWFEVQATNLFDDPDVQGILINARAVDDRKAAEELLLLSEARFKSLVQNNSDLVMVIDPHERVDYASPSAVTMVGESAEALYGRPMSGVFTGADIDWNTRLREAAKDAKTFEFGFTHTSGDWLTFEAVVTDLRSEPAVRGFVLNARDITERKTMMRHLRHQATHDSLTGMPNRVLLTEELDLMLSHNPGNSSVAAICIDLDDFRDINDSLGQAVGDEVLIAVSERIRSTLSFGDQAARIGADEFAVIVERAHGEDAVLEMTQMILDALAQPFHFEGRELSLSASAGMAVDHKREVMAEGLLRSAITAMHQAKREGRGRVARFEHSMRAASSTRLELRGDLARAIGTDQFVVDYQPIVTLGSGKILGAEALVRWDHPERGRLSPALFIPIAEDSGLIGRLDAQVREQALADLASWRSEIPGIEDLTVSVNLSVGELHADDLVESVLRDLRLSEVPNDALVLEVTESNLLDDTDRVRKQMDSLRSHGIRLAVDDFGTGYSSLGYIDRFDFDILKIDRSFVAGLANETNRRIIAAVLDLASELDAKVVAEGIETEMQEADLVDMGCRVGQGYLYSRPVPAAQFRRLLTGVASVGA